MEINDPRVRTEVVDGQVLYFPTPENIRTVGLLTNLVPQAATVGL